MSTKSLPRPSPIFPDVFSPERLREVCATVLDQTHRQGALIEAMLGLAGSQQSELVVEPVRVDDVVRRVLTETDLRSLDITTALDEVTIPADPTLCERAIANLVGNAVRHNVDGGSIQITLTEDELVVTNTCLPVEAERVPALREPFRRGATDRTATQGGLGLGLAILDTIADRHDWGVDFAVPETGRFRAVLSFR